MWVDTSATGAGAPTPSTDYFVTTVGTPLLFSAAQLAKNDADPSGASLNIVDVGDTANNGIVTGTAASGFTYHAEGGVRRYRHDPILGARPGRPCRCGHHLCHGPRRRQHGSGADRRVGMWRGRIRVSRCLCIPSANDSDPDGDAFSIVSVDTPAHGTVVQLRERLLSTRRTRRSRVRRRSRTRSRTPPGLLGVEHRDGVGRHVRRRGTGAPTPSTDYFVTTVGTPLLFSAAQLAKNDVDPSGHEFEHRRCGRYREQRDRDRARRRRGSRTRRRRGSSVTTRSNTWCSTRPAMSVWAPSLSRSSPPATRITRRSRSPTPPSAAAGESVFVSTVGERFGSRW